MIIIEKRVKTARGENQMKRIAIPVAALCILMAGYFACCAAVEEGHLLPNTTVNGIDISGMEEKEALEQLESDRDARRNKAAVPVLFAGKRYLVAAGEAMEWNDRTIIEENLRLGQSAFWARGYFWIKSFLTGNHRHTVPAVRDREAFAEAVEASGLFKAGTATQTTYWIKGEQLVFSMGVTGEKADKAALMEELTAALLAGDNREIECPRTVEKADLPDLDRVYREIHQNARNATLDPERGYRITASVTGVDFDKTKAEQALKQAKEGSTVTVDLLLEEPEITTEMLKEYLFADKLATYTTQVSGTANRKENISLAAEKCNGVILLEDEVFSFNDTVGEQTAETGFKLANATADGELIQAYGGGICQVSSTVFAAALYANLDIAERWEHEYVSRYIDAGIDAAVAWDALDLKICNDRKYPIQIEVLYEAPALTVTIWGTKTDDSIVEIETETVEDTENRFCVQTYRKVYNGDKSQMVLEKVAYSTYLN